MIEADADARNNGATTGRNQDGTFAAGNSGRPLGARHKATVAAESILEGNVRKLTKKAVEMALAGDGQALRLCLERIVPARKSRPIKLTLPKIESAADVLTALGAVIAAVAAGEIDADEGANVVALLDAKRRALETVDMEQRLIALEKVKRK